MNFNELMEKSLTIFLLLGLDDSNLKAIDNYADLKRYLKSHTSVIYFYKKVLAISESSNFFSDRMSLKLSLLDAIVLFDIKNFSDMREKGVAFV